MIDVDVDARRGLVRERHEALLRDAQPSSPRRAALRLDRRRVRRFRLWPHLGRHGGPARDLR